VQSLRTPIGRRRGLAGNARVFHACGPKIDGRLSIALKFAQSDVGSNRQMNFAFASEIDDDVLAKIKDEFLEFPVWW
jgi:hypothetical protein